MDGMQCLIDTIQRRIKEEKFVISGKGLDGDLKDVSWRSGQIKAFKETLFVIRGLFPEAFEKEGENNG